jgi:hypothetical protein
MAANLEGLMTCIGPGKDFESTRLSDPSGQRLANHLMHADDEYPRDRTLWRRRAAGIRSVVCV